MEVSQKIVDAANRGQFSPSRGLHSLHGFSVGHSWLEGKSALGHRSHEQHSESVGKGETGGCINCSSLFLYTSIDSGADNGICGHKKLLSYIVAQVAK